MNENMLTETLRAMVLEHGVERVEQALRNIRMSNGGSSHPSSSFTARSKPQGTADIDERQREKNTAVDFVSKLDIPPELGVLIGELAKKYDRKKFLPTIGDIKNFCIIHGIDTPASLSRVSAVPRIFKHLSRTNLQEVQFMVQTGAFAGPSRLGPIADAIGRNSKKKLNEKTQLGNNDSSHVGKKATKVENPSKPPLPLKM